MPAASAYCASKAALEAASEVFAIEGRPLGLRVVVIETGATDTAMSGKFVPPSRESPYWPFMRNTMAFLAAQQSRLSTPNDIADGIAGAVKDPKTPFRIALGQASPELMGLRSSMSDDEWITTAGGPTREFVSLVDRAEPKFSY
jgi:NAD(P)-dependent dehydrogenase (short-subunit alcohol dehydrogenase family)